MKPSLQNQLPDSSTAEGNYLVPKAVPPDHELPTITNKPIEASSSIRRKLRWQYWNFAQESALIEIGCDLRAISGNGSCQFTSILEGLRQLDQIKPLTSLPSELAAVIRDRSKDLSVDRVFRGLIRQFIETNPDLKDFFLPGELAQITGRTHSWGDETTLRPAEKMLKSYGINLLVIQVSLEGRASLVSSCFSPSFDLDRTVILLYNGHSHYDLVNLASPASDPSKIKNWFIKTGGNKISLDDAMPAKPTEPLKALADVTASSSSSDGLIQSPASDVIYINQISELLIEHHDALYPIRSPDGAIGFIFRLSESEIDFSSFRTAANCYVNAPSIQSPLKKMNVSLTDKSERDHLVLEIVNVNRHNLDAVWEVLVGPSEDSSSSDDEDDDLHPAPPPPTSDKPLTRHSSKRPRIEKKPLVLETHVSDANYVSSYASPNLSTITASESFLDFLEPETSLILLKQKIYEILGCKNPDAVYVRTLMLDFPREWQSDLEKQQLSFHMPSSSTDDLQKADQFLSYLRTLTTSKGLEALTIIRQGPSLIFQPITSETIDRIWEIVLPTNSSLRDEARVTEVQHHLKNLLTPTTSRELSPATASPVIKPKPPEPSQKSDLNLLAQAAVLMDNDAEAAVMAARQSADLTEITLALPPIRANLQLYTPASSSTLSRPTFPKEPHKRERRALTLPLPHIEAGKKAIKFHEDSTPSLEKTALKKAIQFITEIYPGDEPFTPKTSESIRIEKELDNQLLEEYPEISELLERYEQIYNPVLEKMIDGETPNYRGVDLSDKITALEGLFADYEKISLKLRKNYLSLFHSDYLNPVIDTLIRCYASLDLPQETYQKIPEAQALWVKFWKASKSTIPPTQAIAALQRCAILYRELKEAIEKSEFSNSEYYVQYLIREANTVDQRISENHPTWHKGDIWTVNPKVCFQEEKRGSAVSLSRRKGKGKGKGKEKRKVNSSQSAFLFCQENSTPKASDTELTTSPSGSTAE